VFSDPAGGALATGRLSVKVDLTRAGTMTYTTTGTAMAAATARATVAASLGWRATIERRLRGAGASGSISIATPLLEVSEESLSGTHHAGMRLFMRPSHSVSTLALP
jgi:hypothetical protein